MPSTGLVLHHGIDSGAELAGYASTAEDAGFDSLWVTERYFHEETFSMLGYMAAATSRIGLGVGVVNPFTRDPALLAMAAATVDRLSGGRFVLGLGRSEKRVVQGHLDIPYNAPVQALERAVDTVRALLSGESVTVDEDTEPVRLSVPPVQSPPKIYLAAIGPRALSLAGRIADGVILNTYTPSGYVEWAVERVRTAAAEVGRDPDSVEVTCMLALRLTDDPDALLPGLRRRVARLLAEPGMGELLLGRAGLDTDLVGAIREAQPTGDSAAAAMRVPDDLVRQLYVLGDTAECKRRIEEYRAAGVDQPLLLPPLSDLNAVAEALAPIDSASL